MSDWEMYKPVLTALALPPVPFWVLILLGARLILPRRGLGYLLVLLGLMGIWLSATQGMALLLQDHALRPAAPLLTGEQARLETAGRAYAQQQILARHVGRHNPTEMVPPAVILVLGGGRQLLAPEYGVSDLSMTSASRLRYGVWLSRRTGLPLGFSGGVGWAQKGVDPGPAEADVAARVSDQWFGVPLRYIENGSSDTRANAALSIALLAQQGVTEVVLVTDAFHMPRAQRAFVEAARKAAVAHPEWPVVKVTPAPTGYWRHGERPVLDWLPSADGMKNVHQALREKLGWAVGS
jgi:uncharacterized SAM-binding protein YcdF (DUF218 family)